MSATILLLLMGLLPILFWGLIFYFISKAIVDIGTAGITYHKIKKDKETNFHYYDREDMYFDYYQGQWFYKPGYPLE